MQSVIKILEDKIKQCEANKKLQEDFDKVATDEQIESTRNELKELNQSLTHLEGFAKKAVEEHIKYYYSVLISAVHKKEALNEKLSKIDEEIAEYKKAIEKLNNL